MSTAKDYVKEDMDKRPEQLQREADAVRADMEHTVDDLIHQFSPGELINQAMNRLGNGGGSSFVHNLSKQVQNNPIPALLAGVSLTWLMSASKQPPTAGNRPGESLSQGFHSASGSMSSATDKARSATDSMAESAKDKQQHLAEGTEDMKQQVGDAGRHALENTRSGAHAAQNTFNDLLREQPLVVGALAVAAGAALGAMLPRTHAEDRTVGELSDEQKENMKLQAERRAEDMKEAARSKMDGAPEGQSASTDSPDSQTGSTSTGNTAGTTSGPESARGEPAASPTPSRVATTPDSPAAGTSGPGDNGRP